MVQMASVERISIALTPRMAAQVRQSGSVRRGGRLVEWVQEKGSCPSGIDPTSPRKGGG